MLENFQNLYLNPNLGFNLNLKANPERWLGLVPYSWALELQEGLVERVYRNSNELFVLGLEHPKVITFGKRSKISDDLKLGVEEIENLGFQYYEVDRGGHATLHNPGQLVIYPIINLKEKRIAVRSFVDCLVKTTQVTLSEIGIQTQTCKDQPGLYTSNGKIAFLGLRIKEGVSYHGLAINVVNNTEDFSFIRSCGVDCESFDKVANYSEIKNPELFKIWVESFYKFSKDYF